MERKELLKFQTFQFIFRSNFSYVRLLDLRYLFFCVKESGRHQRCCLTLTRDFIARELVPRLAHTLSAARGIHTKMLTLQTVTAVCKT